MVLVSVALLLVVGVASDVASVDAANFDEVVAGSSKAWLINFANAGKQSTKFDPQWKELTGSLKRLELGSVDTGSDSGKELALKFKISLTKMPYVAIFKHSSVAHATPIMEGTLAATKILKKRLKRALKGLEKDAGSGKFLKTAEEPKISVEYEQAR